MEAARTPSKQGAERPQSLDLSLSRQSRQVLLLRRGIPISLAGVFSLCCGAVGLSQPLAAANVPFHFLLAARLS